MRLLWAPVATVAAAILFAPTFVAVWLDADYLWTAHESLAYRFFYAQRWLEREPTDLFLPQGYTTSLVHMLLYSLVVREHPTAETLRAAFQAFGEASGLFWFAVLAAGLAWFLARPSRTLYERLTALVLTVAPLLCTGPYGWNYLLAPDYHQSSTVLAIMTALLLIETSHRPRVSWWTVAALGGWAGLLAANKVSWLPFGLLPLVPVGVAQLGCWRRFAATGLIGAAGAVAGCMLVLTLLYSGDAQKVLHLIPLWWRYILSFGEEPAFWGRFVDLYLVGGNLGPIAVTAEHLALVVAVRIRGRQLLTLAALVAVASVAVWALSRRPAGTTSYETTVMLLAICAMLAGAAWQTDRVIRVAGRLVLVGAVMLWIATFHGERHYRAATLAHSYATDRWMLFQEIAASGRPVVVVIPANDYGASSVSQAILKGLTRPGTAGILAGNPAVDRLVPAGLTIRVDGGNESLNDPYPPGSVLVLYERTDRDWLTTRFPAIRKAVKRRDCEARMLSDWQRARVCR